MGKKTEKSIFLTKRIKSKYLIFLFISLSILSFYLGWSFKKIPGRDKSTQIVTTTLKPKATAPVIAPDETSNEEECVSTFRGVKDYTNETDAGAHPIPSRVPQTTCKKIYSEPRLTFSYSCNLEIIPKVEKEISSTCGQIREFYVTEKISDETVGEFSVYPKNSLIDFVYENNTTTKIYNTDSYTVSDFLKRHSGDTKTTYKDKKTGAIINFYHERFDYKLELLDIYNSLVVFY